MPLSRKLFVLTPALLLSLGSGLWAGNPLTSWWSSDEEAPPGSRQFCYGGKSWPIEPRPSGKSAPFVQTYHHAHYWPDPYRWEDRGIVRRHMITQTDAGWVVATTLYEQHFDPETQELNEAGRMQLRWILQQTPPHRRTTYVATSDSAKHSQTRLASVQRESLEIAGTTGNCPIMLRNCQNAGTTAQDVDLSRRAYLASVPTPRVPFVSQSGGSSSASSSSPQSPGTGSR